MSESAQPNEVVFPVWVRKLKQQAIALAIVILVLYLPLMWLAFDLKLSPYSGVLVLSPAFAICGLVQVPIVGAIISIVFLTLAYIAMSFSLARSRIWLISTCLVLAAISTESSREIFQKSNTVVGIGLRSELVEGTIIKRIIYGGE